MNTVGAIWNTAQVSFEKKKKKKQKKNGLIRVKINQSLFFGFV